VNYIQKNSIYHDPHYLPNKAYIYLYKDKMRVDKKLKIVHAAPGCTIIAIRSGKDEGTNNGVS
jgi:hypothetical protein